MLSIYTQTHTPPSPLSGSMWLCLPHRHKGSWEWNGSSWQVEGGASAEALGLELEQMAYYCTWELKQATSPHWASVSSSDNGQGKEEELLQCGKVYVKWRACGKWGNERLHWQRGSTSGREGALTIRTPRRSPNPLEKGPWQTLPKRWNWQQIIREMASSLSQMRKKR